MDSRTVVKQLFRDISTLNFPNPPISRLRYAEPRLLRPDRGPHGRKKNDRQLHSTLKKLFNYLAHGVSKLEYGRTSDAEWTKYFRFASERLRREDNRYYVRALEPDPDEAGLYVNETKEGAQAWFREDFVPRAKQKDQNIFLIGDPGAGKSTFIKYLLNTNSEFLMREKVIFSRFEFLKFANKWFVSIDNIEDTLAHYITFILLRDVLNSTAYSRNPAGGSVRTSIGPFKDERTTAQTLRNAFKNIAGNPKIITEWIASIKNVIAKDTVDQTALAAVPVAARILLVSHFAETHKLILVLDGLDRISIEDQRFETKVVEIFRYIWKNRMRLTDIALDTASIRFNATLVFVMRENTFYFYKDGNQTDVKLVEESTYRVKKIDPKAAIYNAISRAIAQWAIESNIEEDRADELVQSIVKSIFRTFAAINYSIGAGNRPDYILELFVGNIRMLFAFLERLLEWFVEDGLRASKLPVSQLDSLASIFEVMTGREGFLLLRQRSYRIIELLLFFGIPWFENAITIRKQSTFASSMRSDARQGDLYQENEYYTGFIDNVFNYHVTSHDNYAEKHSLLEKIRVIQLLRRRFLTSDEVNDELMTRFGYASPDIDTTIIVLLRTQMIAATVKRGEIYLSATERGLLLIDYLLQTMTYLEHAFHRTLFPEPMIKTIKDEFRTLKTRVAKDDVLTNPVDIWTSASIRNAYIFLTYIRHVEETKANDKRVPDEFRIFSKTQESVMRSLNRILADPTTRTGHTGQHAGESFEEVKRRRELVATESVRMIRSLQNSWEMLSLLE